MVEDEPDGDVQNAGGGVVDEPEGFEVEGVDSVAPGRRARGGAGGGGGTVQQRRWLDGGDVLAVARTVASVDFPPLAASPVDRLGFGGGKQ